MEYNQNETIELQADIDLVPRVEQLQISNLISFGFFLCCKKRVSPSSLSTFIERNVMEIYVSHHT